MYIYIDYTSIILRSSHKPPKYTFHSFNIGFQITKKNHPGHDVRSDRRCLRLIQATGLERVRRLGWSNLTWGPSQRFKGGKLWKTRMRWWFKWLKPWRRCLVRRCMYLKKRVGMWQVLNLVEPEPGWAWMDHHFSTSKIVVTEKTRQDLKAKVMEVWIKGQRVSFSVCETSGFKYSLGVFFLGSIIHQGSISSSWCSLVDLAWAAWYTCDGGWICAPSDLNDHS